MTTHNISQIKNKATHKKPKSIIINHKFITTNTRSRNINHTNQQMVTDNMCLTKKTNIDH